MRANVFWPETEGRYPVLVCAQPCGKDSLPRKTRTGYAVPLPYRLAANDEPMSFAAWTLLEALDPAFWVPQGTSRRALSCTMHLYEVEPPPELRQVIKNFWHLRLDLGPEPTSLEVLPDGYAEIIFYFGNAGGLTVQEGGPRLPSPFLTGLLERPVRFTGSGWLDVVGIKCFPWAVFDLLGLPAGRGGVQTVPHPLAQWQAPLQKLVAGGQVPQALAAAAQYCQTAWLAAAGNPVPGKAGAAMRRANGTLPVHAVAAAAHATVRTLERRFKQAAGHTVKDVSALMRFEQVRDRLWRDPAASLAGLAHELGYADQSHLGQEFKRYSRTTPAAFARQVKQVRRLVDRDFVAFVLT